MTLTHDRQLFFVIAVLTLVAGGVTVLWLFIPRLFWGIGALIFGILTPLGVYLHVVRWRGRTVAVWQNNSWGLGLIKLILQNLWLLLQLLISVAALTKSVEQLACLAPSGDGGNRWVFLGVIAYCSVAAIFLPRVWPLLYKAGLVSTPALRDIVRFSWESRPSSS